MNPSIKTSRILQFLLVAFLVLAIRVWHLAVVQRESHIRAAERPKLRTIWMPSNRGIITDRFDLPLAINKISYNLTIYYDQIAQIPTVAWQTEEDGKRVKTYPRKEHIRHLAKLLQEVLDLDPERTEDLIHSKACLLPHVPFLLKSRLSESQYYRLKMLESQWMGLHAEIRTERFYPLGKTACHLIGTLGSISQKQYRAIVEEIHTLEQALASDGNGEERTLPQRYDSFDAVGRRLYELKEKAYTLNDKIGKTGVEGNFEEDLRGYWGLKTFEVDQKGSILRELPGGKPPIPGRQVKLSISAELQQFAEELLCHSEKQRDGKSIGTDPEDQIRKTQKQPWIKGGAIVALDPKSGEVLAFASHPRFDPNDFVTKNDPKKINYWLENGRNWAALWDGKVVFERERPSPKQKIDLEKQPLSWEFYLDHLLSPAGALRLFFDKFGDIASAIQIQEDFEALLYFSQAADPASLMESFMTKSWITDSLKAHSDAAPYLHRLETSLGSIPSPLDRLFAIDLCRLSVFAPRFSTELITQVGSMKIGTYRQLSQAFFRLEERVKKNALATFDFASWKELHQKEFLAEKRKEEKAKKTFARPYIEYLDAKKQSLFSEFWEQNKYRLILEKVKEDLVDPDIELLKKHIAQLPDPIAEEFFHTFRPFELLDVSLLSKRGKTEQDLVKMAFPLGGFNFSRSYAFQVGEPLGSLFKLIPSYEALRQNVSSFSLIDVWGQSPSKGQTVAYSLNQTAYPRFYKGGRLPRSSGKSIGKIDLIGAIEHSSNPYFAILAGDYFEDPEDLKTTAKQFGMGEKTGIDLFGETAGNLPIDLKDNRTGLYSFAIGQHTLLSTPIQSALMLSAMANGGRLLKPKIVKEIRGLSPSQDPFSAAHSFAREELEALGIHFPLFTGASCRTSLPAKEISNIEMRRSLYMPTAMRNTLFEGMDRSMWSGKGSARASAIRSLLTNPLLMREYLSLEHQVIGKTSTAEILFNPNATPSSKPAMYKHIWFGAISFDAKSLRWETPELVVVVLLRFGDAGKEAAPLATQMIRKWREIRLSHPQI